MKGHRIWVLAVICCSSLILSSAPVYAQSDLPLKTQLSRVGSAGKGACIRLYRGATLTGEQRSGLEEAIAGIRKKKADVGFVMMNLRTGKMITYNPTKTFFGASTVKGPYTIAVNRSKKGAWKKSSAWMEGSGIDIYNDAGIVMSAGGPYVIAVMTSLDGDDHRPIRELVRTLNAIQDTM